MIISILDGNNLTSLSADSGGVGATILWQDTIITDTSLTGPGTQPGTISLGVYREAVGLQLMQG